MIAKLPAHLDSRQVGCGRSRCSRGARGLVHVARRPDPVWEGIEDGQREQDEDAEQPELEAPRANVAADAGTTERARPYWALRKRSANWEPLCSKDTLDKRRSNVVALRNQVVVLKRKDNEWRAYLEPSAQGPLPSGAASTAVPAGAGEAVMRKVQDTHGLLWMETTSKDQPSHPGEIVPLRQIQWSTQVIASEGKAAVEQVPSPFADATFARSLLECSPLDERLPRPSPSTVLGNVAALRKSLLAAANSLLQGAAWPLTAAPPALPAASSDNTCPEPFQVVWSMRNEDCPEGEDILIVRQRMLTANMRLSRIHMPRTRGRVKLHCLQCFVAMNQGTTRLITGLWADKNSKFRDTSLRVEEALTGLSMAMRQHPAIVPNGTAKGLPASEWTSSKFSAGLPGWDALAESDSDMREEFELDWLSTRLTQADVLSEDSFTLQAQHRLGLVKLARASQFLGQPSFGSRSASSRRSPSPAAAALLPIPSNIRPAGTKAAADTQTGPRDSSSYGAGAADRIAGSLENATCAGALPEAELEVGRQALARRMRPAVEALLNGADTLQLDSTMPRARAQGGVVSALQTLAGGGAAAGAASDSASLPNCGMAVADERFGNTRAGAFLVWDTGLRRAQRTSDKLAGKVGKVAEGNEASDVGPGTAEALSRDAKLTAVVWRKLVRLHNMAQAYKVLRVVAGVISGCGVLAINVAILKLMFDGFNVWAGMMNASGCVIAGLLYVVTIALTFVAYLVDLEACHNQAQVNESLLWLV